MIDPNEVERLRCMKLSEERGDFVRDVDGYWYYWPKGYSGGSLASHHLRWLADWLDQKNLPWDNEVNAFFARQEEQASNDRT